MKLLAAFSLIAGIAFSQHGGTPVQQVQYPYDGPTTRVDYDGSSNAIYIGFASAKQPSFSWTRSATTLTSIVVSSNTATATMSSAHGLVVGNPIVISGSTTSALNGSYKILTIGSSTTFTFTTSGVSDGTYNNAALVASTTAPRGTVGIWSISCLNYTGTNMTAKTWVGGLPASSIYIWDNRATLACQ